MQTKWTNEDYTYEQLILAGDVGGTNTNIALVGQTGGRFTIIMECVFKTSELAGPLEPLKKTLKQAQRDNPQLVPNLCCISGAGPVENNCCTPTNVQWNIDGAEIEKTLGIKTLVINDFIAISYGLVLLDVNNPAQITKLPFTDGTIPAQTGHTMAVVGAGTGLGVSFLVENEGRYRAWPSEAGHIGFAAFDEETRELKEYVTSRAGSQPGVELFASGRGIANIFHYFRDVRKIRLEGILADIDRMPDAEKPPIISDNAERCDVCGDIIKLFVKLYGRFAGDVSTFLLPTMGLYLAGGIAAKNERYFLEDNCFMHFFEQNYNANIRRVLKSIPVYIIRDYAVSLYGAANAGCCLTV